MDCISVYLRGIQNVIATSGTAFTEQQVAILKRHTSQVVVNFDPDAAGSNAAEKSIALLTEEGFNIKIVTLDGGLDPDRYIRERGVEAYTAALRGARRQADYLIERAQPCLSRSQRGAEGEGHELPAAPHPPHAGEARPRPVRRRRRAKAGHRLGRPARGTAPGRAPPPRPHRTRRPHAHRSRAGPAPCPGHRRSRVRALPASRRPGARRATLLV